MTDFLGVIQLIGFVFALSCLLVGMYVVLRWGFCGVSILFSRRDSLDKVVLDEVEKTWRLRG